MFAPNRIDRGLCALIVVAGCFGCSCNKKPKHAKSHSTAIGEARAANTNAPVTSTSAVNNPPTRTACPEFQSGRKLGRVENRDLSEASGLVVSHQNPSVLWSHNDSGGNPRIFAMTETGRDLGFYQLAKVKLEDWEDLAMGPAQEPGQWYLYVGDIGTNTKARHRVSVYRFLEPTVKLDQEPIKHKVNGRHAVRLHVPRSRRPRRRNAHGRSTL